MKKHTPQRVSGTKKASNSETAREMPQRSTNQIQYATATGVMRSDRSTLRRRRKRLRFCVGDESRRGNL
jgi:hypothetical protein